MRVVADMWEAEMRDRLADKNQRIEELERQNALYAAFVAAARELRNLGESETIGSNEDLDAWEAADGRYEAADAALDWLETP